MTESWHDVANKRADRVRELEAELDRTHACAMGRCLCPHDSIIIELEARAEKAEREAAGWETRAAGMSVERTALQARVAELERREEFWHNLALLNVPHEIIERKLKEPGSLLPPDMLREWEREAD